MTKESSYCMLHMLDNFHFKIYNLFFYIHPLSCYIHFLSCYILHYLKNIFFRFWSSFMGLLGWMDKIMDLFYLKQLKIRLFYIFLKICKFILTTAISSPVQTKFKQKCAPVLREICTWVLAVCTCNGG